MSYEELINKYENVEFQLIEDCNCNVVKRIIEIGYTACNNDGISNSKDILVLSGINPSGTEKPNIPWSFQNAEDHGKSQYWSKKHNQFGGKFSELVQKHIAYFDLLPLIESEQGLVEKVFKPYNSFRFQLVKITAKAIEDLKPKLIVHANKGSLYYWGLNPSSFTKDTKRPWLNYSFKEVTTNCPVLAKYIVRLNKYKEANTEQKLSKEYVHLFEMTGNGIKTRTYFMSYIMENPRFNDWQRVQLLSPEEMQGIWEWCCNQ